MAGKQEPCGSERLLEEAYKKTWETQRLFRRQIEMKKQKEEIVHEKMTKAEESKKKALDEKMKQATNMIHWGLWQTEGQVDFMLKAEEK